jgi:hypothetical protein
VVSRIERNEKSNQANAGQRHEFTCFIHEGRQTKEGEVMRFFGRGPLVDGEAIDDETRLLFDQLMDDWQERHDLGFPGTVIEPISETASAPAPAPAKEPKADEPAKVEGFFATPEGLIGIRFTKAINAFALPARTMKQFADQLNILADQVLASQSHLEEKP